MDCTRALQWLLLLSFSCVALRARANTMVTGTVFCDQCRDGKRTVFDYPLYGAKVAITCGGGGMTAYKEESTNWFGSYAARFDGSPDLSGCHARVVGGPPRCAAAVGPAQGVTLLFRVFGMAMYTAGPLVAQPAQPMGLCTHATPPSKGKPSPPLLPPVYRPPPLPFMEASACSFDKWMMPEYKCYWKMVGPETKVALAFGPIAAGKYGMNMTLWEGLQGRGDLYRTLLREGTTALLNSYNSLAFAIPAVTVVNDMNMALLGSNHDALMTAVRFRRANSGTGSSGGDKVKVTCKFTDCS